MTTSQAEELMAALPDEEVLARIINRYTDLILNDLTKVDKGSEKITAGDVSSTYAVIEIKIDAKTELKLCKDILAKLHDDRDVEDVLCAYLEASGMTEEQVDQAFFEFLDWIEEMQEKLEKLTPEEIRTSVIMNVYVDAAGRVRGRDIKIRKDKELVAEVQYVLTLSGLKYGVKAELLAVDGSEESMNALRWALDNLRLRPDDER